MEGDEGGIFSKAPDWIPLFLFKIKIKIQATKIRNIIQSSSAFVKILGSIPVLKKIYTDQWLGRIRTKQDVGKQARFVLNTVMGFGGRQNPRKTFQFLPSFKVGLSPSKNFFVICLTENPIKMIKNAFYFILKAVFLL